MPVSPKIHLPIPAATDPALPFTTGSKPNGESITYTIAALSQLLSQHPGLTAAWPIDKAGGSQAWGQNLIGFPVEPGF